MSLTKVSFSMINGDVVNVLDYGADPTGTHDSRAAIQSAIDENDGKIIFFPTGNYLISSTITIGSNPSFYNVRLQGEAGIRTTVLTFTGGAEPMLVANASLDAFEIDSLCLNNTGTGTVGLQINAVRTIVSHCSSLSTVAWSDAVISNYRQVDYVYNTIIRDCYFSVQTYTPGTEATCLRIGGGHTCVIDAIMTTGFKYGVYQTQNNTTVLYDLTITNSHFEAFGGVTPGYEGGPDAVGIFVDGVYGLNINGCDFQMAGDAEPTSLTQRCIKLYRVEGGFIGGNQMHGGSIITGCISLADSTAQNLLIAGNNAYSVNGDLVVAEGGGRLYNCEIGINNIQSGTRIFNNTFTPVVEIGAGTTGITYSKQYGRWKRSGQWIEFNCVITLSSKGALTGNVRISGLPMFSGNDASNYSSFAVFYAALSGISGTQVAATLEPGSKILDIIDLATGNSLTNTNLTNTSQFIISGAYYVDNP